MCVNVDYSDTSATTVWSKLKSYLVHKSFSGVVNCIKIRDNDSECVSASDDGTCIVWDLNRFTRNQIIFANTLFKSVCYHPEEIQLLTGGSDRKVTVTAFCCTTITYI